MSSAVWEQVRMFLSDGPSSASDADLESRGLCCHDSLIFPLPGQVVVERMAPHLPRRDAGGDASELRQGGLVVAKASLRISDFQTPNRSLSRSAFRTA